MEKNLNKKLKLEKITIKDKGWAVDAIESKKLVEKAEDANEPTRVEPEVVEPVDMDYGTQRKIADREERIKAIIIKRLKPSKDIAKETKAEDKAILGKDIKIKESDESLDDTSNLDKTFEKNTKVVIFNTSRDAYSKEDAIESACTVGELIDWLQHFNGNEKVIYAFDGGYTYGSVSTDDVFPRTLRKDNDDELEEASTAERKSLKLGGEATDDLARGRGIASIKDKDERDAAVAALKAGRKDLVDKEFIGDRKNLHVENDLDKKATKMQRAMEEESSDDDVNAAYIIDEAQAQALIGTQETLNENVHQEVHVDSEQCPMIDSQTLAAMQDDDNI